MKKIIYLIFVTIICTNEIKSQVGINTSNPISTLDIKAKNPTGSATDIDGLLIPRIDRQRAQSMQNIPSSTLVYIENIATGSMLGQASNVDSIGYYYFDGASGKWSKLISSTSSGLFALSPLTTSTVLGVNSSGGIRTPGSEFVIKDDGKVGIGTASPSAKLEVSGNVRISNTNLGAANAILGRNSSGDVTQISVGDGLSLSSGILKSATSSTTIVNSYLISNKIDNFNVTTQTSAITVPSDAFTLWISGPPNVGAGNCHVRLPVTTNGRIINIIAAGGQVNVCSNGINATNGVITVYNSSDLEIFNIPYQKRASFQYISNTFTPAGTWIVEMKDF